MERVETYNDRVVRQFAIMTVVWGIVGMLVGVIIAAQLLQTCQDPSLYNCRGAVRNRRLGGYWSVRRDFTRSLHWNTGKYSVDHSGGYRRDIAVWWQGVYHRDVSGRPDCRRVRNGPAHGRGGSAMDLLVDRRPDYRRRKR